MRGIDLTNCSVPIYWILKWSVEVTSSHEALSADMWLQADSLHVWRQLEGDPQISAVLAERDGLAVSVNEAANNISLFISLSVIIKFTIETLLASASISVALVIDAQFQCCKASTPAHSNETFHEFNLEHVLSLHDFNGGSNAIPSLVVVTLCFEAILCDQHKHVLVVDVQLALEVALVCLSH